MSSWSAATLKSLHHPSLKDRVVLITGGSRGFGWFIAAELLRAGATVALTASRHPDELAEVRNKAAEIAGADRCLTLRADVTNWDDCLAAVATTAKTFGRIDVLINNAGRGTSEYRGGMAREAGRRGAFYDIPPEAFRTIIETNVLGVFNMSKAAMPHFLNQGRGKMFAISTSLTTMIAQGLSPYGASKAALEIMHRVWAQELKDKQVDVNILLPGGPSDTAFITQTMVTGQVGARAQDPANHLLPGDVIVPPAVWLCSDATNGLTGQRIIAKFWPQDAAPDAALKRCLQPLNELPGMM